MDDFQPFYRDKCMNRIISTSVFALFIFVFCVRVRPVNAQLVPANSASFTYKYEMNYLPEDVSHVDLDGNSVADFSLTGPHVGVSSGILTIASYNENNYFNSDSVGNIWYNNSASYKANGYTIEFRAKVLDSPGFAGSFLIGAVPSGSTQNSLLSIKGGATFWGNGGTQLSTASNTDGFHVFRIAQLPNPSGNASYNVWRDGTLLASGLSAPVTGSYNRLLFGDASSQIDGMTQVDYVRYTPGVYAPALKIGAPIVTYWDGPDLTTAVAQQAVAGGFNTVWTYTVNQLAIAEQHGLRAMVYNRDILSPASLDGGPKQAVLDAFIDSVKNSPATYMYFLADEPMVSEFAGLGALASYIRARDPNHAPYVNLLANDGVTGAPNYASYLNQYITSIRPSIISYDHYNLMTSGGQPYDMPLFFQNLAQVSLASRQSGIPFMPLVQAIKTGDPWRVPNANELRFLGYSALAYGAQGISWFNYHRKYWPDAEGGLEPYPNGTPTAVFTALATLDPQLKAIASQMQNLYSVGAYHLGDQPPGTTRLPLAISPFTLSPSVPNTTYVEGARVKGFLMGFWGPDTELGHAWFTLVQNLDYTSNATTTVYGPGNLSIFNASTGTWSWSGQNWITLSLAPGEGVLVGLTAYVSELQQNVVPEPPGVFLLASSLAIVCVHRLRMSKRRVTFHKNYCRSSK